MSSKIKSSSNTSKNSIKPTGGSKQSVTSIRATKEEEKISLAYKVLPPEETKEFIEACDVDHLQQLVAKFLSLFDSEYNLRQLIMIDYYVAGLWWCREQNFNGAQTSAFYTLMDTLVKNIEKQMTMTDCLAELKRMFAGVGQEVPEICGGLQDLFDISESKCILDYFYLELEVPRSAMSVWPPPLDEAINEADQKLYIIDPKPLIEPSKEDGCRMNDFVIDKRLEEDLLSKLSPEEVKKAIDEVYAEMLTGVEAEVAGMLHQRKNDYLNRINAIHIVAVKPLTP